MNLSDRITARFAAHFRERGRRRNLSTADAVVRAAEATIRRKRYGILVTDSAEAPTARTLQPLHDDDVFDAWLGTSPHSRKVAQLARRPECALVYADDARAACVTVRGTAEIVNEPDARRRHFPTMWRAFFPEGPDHDDFLLLRFTAVEVDVWDPARRVSPDPFGLAASTIRRSDSGWVLQ